jgi:phosphatidylserine synthase
MRWLTDLSSRKGCSPHSLTPRILTVANVANVLPRYKSTRAVLQHTFANALTCGNLAAGVAATLMKRDGQRVRRSTLILLGATCDTFDGTFARRAGHATVPGARADGFADVVTCGVAPTVLLARLAEGADSRLVRLAPYLYMGGIAFRVIKNGFPARTSHINEGLPVTGAGIAIAVAAQLRLPPRTMGHLTVAIVAAMLSRISIPSGEALVRPRHVRANGYRVAPPQPASSGEKSDAASIIPSYPN